MFKNLLTLIICLLGVSAWGQLVNDGATITIQDGATLVVEGDVTNNAGGVINTLGTLEVKGNVTHNGATFDLSAATSKLIFSGTGTSNVTGTPLVAHTVEIQKTNADVILGTGLTVSSLLDFSGGTGSNVVLGTNNLTLGNSASINGADETNGFVETDNTGMLQKTSQSGSFTFPIGFSGASDDEYNPITVNNTGPASTIGARALQEVLDQGDSGTALDQDVIKASWEVSGGDLGVLDVTVNFDSDDEGSTYDASISGIAQWTGTNPNEYWDHAFNDPIPGATSATREDLSAGIFAVGGESLMDEAPMNLQTVLSGPFISTSSPYMSTGLTAVLPTNEPYGGMAGFTHKGLGGNEMGPVDYTGSNVVDWVFIEMRDETASSTNVLATKSALLLNDGTIVDEDLNPLVLKGLRTGINSKGYNFVIRHRNHLGVMTASKFGENSLSRTDANLNTIDFKTGGAIGTNPMKSNSGIMGLWEGDVNQDNFIKYNGSNSDRVSILLEVGFLTPNDVISGYSSNDVNLDGLVKYNGSNSDRVDMLLNVGFLTPNDIISGTIPNN